MKTYQIETKQTSSQRRLFRLLLGCWQHMNWRRFLREANVDVFKFYKRIDRFRWIYLRHYCSYVDSSEAHCSWATTAMNGEKFDKPFRQMSWVNNKYGIEATNPFIAPTEAPYVKPEGYTEHSTAWGTVWTKVYDDFYTWGEGEVICANDGDFLHQPIPSNQYENDFFFNLVGARNDRDMWLGITDSADEGKILYYRLTKRLTT